MDWRLIPNRDSEHMEPIPQPPDSAGRPSSVTRRTAPEVAKPESDVARALPAADPADETPTIISLNRPRPSENIESLQGKKLGHFELIEPIGVGGMAAVI